MLSEKLLHNLLKVETCDGFEKITLPINYFGSEKQIELFVYEKGEHFDISDNAKTFENSRLDREQFISFADEWRDVFEYDIVDNAINLKDIDKEYILNAISVMVQAILVVGDHASKGEHRIVPDFDNVQ